jgi:7-keto-8-aminopelargonate synthetase-like enzyme
MGDLERVLRSTSDKWGKIIVVDGLFSMEGDITPLPEVIALAKKYGARVMVDDAHAVGVLGEGGRGTAEHFHMEDEVDVIMGTYSKSLAAIGGFIVASKKVANYVRHFARSLIFSASLAPPLVAAVSTALDVIQDEPERRERLWYNTRKMLKGFKEIGFDTGNSETPIIPIIIGDQMKTFQMCGLLEEYGIFVNPTVSPAVPPGRELLRTSYMATHTEEQLDRILSAFERAGRQLGVI